MKTGDESRALDQRPLLARRLMAHAAAHAASSARSTAATVRAVRVVVLALEFISRLHDTHNPRYYVDLKDLWAYTSSPPRATWHG